MSPHPSMWPRRIDIEALVTHPGTYGGGSLLIEHVVNLSEKTGGGGRVVLGANPGWRDSFKAKGFADYSEFSQRKLKLNPSRSDKWVKVGDEWRLKKYEVRKTFAGSPEDLLLARDLLPARNWPQLIVGREIGGGSLHPSVRRSLLGPKAWDARRAENILTRTHYVYRYKAFPTSLN